MSPNLNTFLNTENYVVICDITHCREIFNIVATSVVSTKIFEDSMVTIGSDTNQSGVIKLQRNFLNILATRVASITGMKIFDDTLAAIGSDTNQNGAIK